LFLERYSISRDDPESTRLKGIDDTVEKLQKEQSVMKVKWEEERKIVIQLQELKNEIDAAQIALQKAEREYDLNQAAILKFGKIPELTKKLAVVEKQYEEEKSKGSRLLRDTVGADDIAMIVSSWTRIPVAKLLQGEMEKLLTLQGELDKRVIGQEQATKVVAEAIQRSRAGMADPMKPIASLVFLGPTGVGKTELCKTLAKYLFDSEEALVRIDMSEYMEQHSVSRLIGAPPGYIGYDEGGQLTESVRRKPYCVILFDEMEKAHPEVFNILLQLLDDGRLTDSKGNVVNFRNTIIIFTSNLGSSEISKAKPNDTKQIRDVTMAALKQRFRPEFLNRIDDYVVFNQLSKKELLPIVDLEMAKVQQRLVDRKILIELADGAKSWLAEMGYDVTYGARPLKRTIQRYVENPISRGILEGRFKNGDTILLDADAGDSELTITNENSLKGLKVAKQNVTGNPELPV
jgi:ATP-dependent Clp protease ATP-binding subunit ClpB